METETGDIGHIVRNANRSEIHRRTGISLSGVSRILGGGRSPRTINLKKVAEQLGVSMDELYDYLTHLRGKRRRKIAG